MGNHNSGFCSTNQLSRRDNISNDVEERPRIYPGGRRGNTQSRSRSGSVERRRRGRRNRDVSPKGRRSSRPSTRPRSNGNPNKMSPKSQQQAPRNVASPSRFSYDIPSRKGSSYVDPLSFTPSVSGLGELRGGNSSIDLWYFTSTSPAAGRTYVTSRSRKATNSHNLRSRGTNLDDDSEWRETEAKGRSWGVESERPAYRSHVSPVREKVYSWAKPQVKPDKSRLVAPGRQKVHSDIRGQKRNNNVRESSAQQSCRDSANLKTQYVGHHQVSRGREDSFLPPSHGRERRNAVRLDSFEMPSGVYKGDRRYIQFGDDIWETVIIDGWNHWNGTWQVLDSNGRSIQAAPIALKTEDEYRFLSKERTIRYRSFGSFV